MGSNHLEQARWILSCSGIWLSEKEFAQLEITDFGLNDFEHVGLFVHTYVNTSRCCAKELILLPGQSCPEHRHPPIGSSPGKEETFRCRFGCVSLFLPGPASVAPSRTAPASGHDWYTVWNEHVLHAGDQITLEPNTLHWFQAHDEGAVVSEFSTHSDDDSDIFTDPAITRAARV